MCIIAHIHKLLSVIMVHPHNSMWLLTLIKCMHNQALSPSEPGNKATWFTHTIDRSTNGVEKVTKAKRQRQQMRSC